jgi:hypothetical protein
MQLRYFAALHDTASERSSTIVFPLPTDLLTHLAPRPDGARWLFAHHKYGPVPVRPL